MAVKTAFPSKEKTYKVPCCAEDAACLSDGHDTSYIKVDHLPPFPRFVQERSTALNVVVVVVLLVSLIVNVALVVFICTGGSEDDTPPPPPPPPPPHTEGLVSVEDADSVCTGCSTLGVSSEVARSVHHPHLDVRQLDDGSLLCCMQNAGSLWRLAQILADVHVLTNSNQSESRVSTGAHLYADSDSLKKQPPSLAWSDEYGFGSSYVKNVIRHDNQLVVPKPGLYHIYSFFTFKTLQQRVSPDNVLHTMYRENPKLARIGSRVMLMDKKTLPEARDKFVTSFLSTTVRLRQDDQLYVKVSNLSYVYPFAPSNFFGLFFLGDLGICVGCFVMHVC